MQGALLICTHLDSLLAQKVAAKDGISGTLAALVLSGAIHVLLGKAMST